MRVKRGYTGELTIAEISEERKRLLLETEGIIWAQQAALAERNALISQLQQRIGELEDDRRELTRMIQRLDEGTVTARSLS